MDVYEDYAEALEALVSNSRPIIKTLTELAIDGISFKTYIGDAIEHHVTKCPPNLKLPALYLIDSICKHSKEYAEFFTPLIAEIFINAFESVNDFVKPKLHELLKSWHSSPMGPVFPNDVLLQITSKLFPAQIPQNFKPRLTQSGVLVEINRLRKLLLGDPEDVYNENLVQLLTRIESEISGVVDPKQLPEYMQQLDEIKQNRDRHLKSGMAGVDRRRKRPRSRNEHNLDKPPHATRNEVLKPAKRNNPLDLAFACANDATPSQLEALFSPLQCATCGFRFPDTEEGRQQKQQEMDWHFRANKDIRENHSRNRTWFLSLKMFIDYRDENEVYFNLDTANENVMQGDAKIDLDQERKKYIDVPADTSAVCPVCQEPHTASWSEEAENWVWMNAVEVDGEYFHATCYANR